jgi:hypothetical protein
MVKITRGELGGTEEDEPQSLIEAISEAESDEENNKFILMIREIVESNSESSALDPQSEPPPNYYIDLPSLLDQSILPKDDVLARMKTTFQELLDAVANLIEKLAAAAFLTNNPEVLVFYLLQGGAIGNWIVTATQELFDASVYNEAFTDKWTESYIQNIVNKTVDGGSFTNNTNVSTTKYTDVTYSTADDGYIGGDLYFGGAFTDGPYTGYTSIPPATASGVFTNTDYDSVSYTGPDVGGTSESVTYTNTATTTVIANTLNTNATFSDGTTGYEIVSVVTSSAYVQTTDILPYLNQWISNGGAYALNWKYRTRWCSETFIVCIEYTTSNVNYTTYYDSISPYMEYLKDGTNAPVSTTSTTTSDREDYTQQNAEYYNNQNNLDAAYKDKIDYVSAAMVYVSGFNVKNSQIDQVTVDSENGVDVTYTDDTTLLNDMMDEVNKVSGQFQYLIKAMFGESIGSETDYSEAYTYNSNNNYLNWWTDTYKQGLKGEVVEARVSQLFGGDDSNWGSVVTGSGDTLDEELTAIGEDLSAWELGLYNALFLPMVNEGTGITNSYLDAQLQATASVLAYIGTVMLTDPPSVTESTEGDSDLDAANDLGDTGQTTTTGS